MPGVIMDGGSRNGAHTNHDRDVVMNGANGTFPPQERAYDKAKSRGEPLAQSRTPQIVNGLNGALPEPAVESQDDVANVVPMDISERIQQLPPEIVHITEGFEPLSKLLSRLAQVTHNRLSAKILELASLPVPSSAVNGNGAHYGNGSDDNSVDNVRKKVNLLKFAEETHANWTKALVITHWSRVSEDVSKVIDLKIHLDRQKTFYDEATYHLMEVKRGLQNARVPNPDLRTAVEVLTTGEASWMPDLEYIEPPPLTAKDLLKSLKDLNTLLSIRLNLHEYDKIPLQFKDYSIGSGRVTFRVAGEFEVDLTIADESPEEQFWFIDFRFLFSPAVAELPEHLRYMIENRVNAVLKREGLAGCYRFLHELVLTHKISEIRRQAIELGRGRWIDTLQVEPLHRALSIQYWVDRYGKDGPKSWIILGVHSGKRKDGGLDPKTNSRISLRWFRDSKEVKDHDISIELNSISAEALLQTVVSEHIIHILGSTYKNLRARKLFSDQELSIAFQTPKKGSTEEAKLVVQLTRDEHISLSIEPITGHFSIRPASRLALQAEWKLNSQTRDPAANAHDFIENLRCVAVSDEIISRALSVGWVPIRNPGLKQEDLKPIVPRDTLQLSWFRRAGWKQEWVVALSSGMSGERWWIFEIINQPQAPKIKTHLQMPLAATSPSHTHAFLSRLHLYAAAIISYYSNLNALHSQHAQYLLQNGSPKAAASIMKLPSVYVKLSDILRTRNRSSRTGKAWAKDILKIGFQGLAYPPKASGIDPGSLASQSEPTATTEIQPSSGAPEIKRLEDDDEENAIVVAEGCLSKPIPSSLDLVRQRVDKDIAFHPKSGGFAFRLHTKVGEPAIVPLIERLQRIEQLVEFVDVVKKHEATLHCETISLGKLIFSYGAHADAEVEDKKAVDVAVNTHDKTYRAIIDFSGASTPMTLTLEVGNPQIRILDHLTKTLNSPIGLNGVATLLPLTLPLMAALDAIEEAWTPLVDRGDVLIFNRAIDWHIIRYDLIPIASDQRAPKVRKVMLEIRLQHRRRSAWWCIRRERERERGERADKNLGDDVDLALKAVWEDNLEGERWRGMSSSAIARPDGIEELLGKVDQTIRELAVRGITQAAPPTDVKETPQLPTAAQQKQNPSQNPRGDKNNRSTANTTAASTTMARAKSNPNARPPAGGSGPKHEMIVID